MSDSTSEVPATPPPVVEPSRPAPSGGRGRYLLVELGIVTAGVLIALSVDSFREWSQHRALVAEARRHIVQEIQDNTRALEGVVSASAERRAQIDNALTLVNDLLAKKQSSINSFTFNSTLLDVSDANWKSAERTGALAHMDYSEVRKYSGLYDLQALYSDSQRNYVDHFAGVMSTIDGSPHEASPRDLERFRERLLDMRGDLLMSDKLAKELLEAYRKAQEQ